MNDDEPRTNGTFYCYVYVYGESNTIAGERTYTHMILMHAMHAAQNAKLCARKHICVLLQAHTTYWHASEQQRKERRRIATLLE